MLFVAVLAACDERAMPPILRMGSLMHLFGDITDVLFPLISKERDLHSDDSLMANKWRGDATGTKLQRFMGQTSPGRTQKRKHIMVEV
jgi:hypothetical protein